MDHSAFLNLPLEVRAEIYGYLLPIDSLAEVQESVTRYLSPVYSPTSRAPYSPTSPTYSPTSPNYSPTSPTYSPTTHIYDPSTLQWVPRTGSPGRPGFFPDLPSPVTATPHAESQTRPTLSIATPASHPLYYAPGSPYYLPESPDVSESPYVVEDSPEFPQVLSPKAPKPEFSILCVNKQIHSEVKEFLYRRGVIEINIELWGSVLHNGTKDHVNVYYKSPWEDLEYKHAVDSTTDTRETYYFSHNNGVDDGRGDAAVSNAEYLSLRKPGVILSPQPEYRKYLRQVHITIRDIRESSDVNNFKELEDLIEKTKLDSQMLLLPILWRLRETLSDLTTVHLAVFPMQRHFQWRSKGRDAEKVARYKSYERALETAFLLTRGPWKSTVKLMPFSFSYCKSAGIEQETFSKFEGCPEFQEDALQERLAELKVDIPQDAWWGTSKGKLVLFDPSYHRVSPITVTPSPVYDVDRSSPMLSPRSPPFDPTRPVSPSWSRSDRSPRNCFS
ncbi:hypothetical protein TWF281_004551 [Arthrobotrys megalospora]